MSKITDELRDVANEQDLGPYGPEVKAGLRQAANLLDEAEKALAPLCALADAAFYVDEDGRMMNASKPDDQAIWGLDRTMLTYGDLRRARTTLARIRGEQ